MRRAWLLELSATTFSREKDKTVADPTSPLSDGRRIVLVIGPGRSGTSTIAGALAKSGFEVPGKAIEGNATNPSGFFEPRWVVNLHKELLDRTGVATLDTGPEAYERVNELVMREEVRERLRTWLSDRLDAQPRLVVKDPRTVWFKDLWMETSRELGVEPSFITMLRHPAEVSASRRKYYSKRGDDNLRADDVARIAGWLNVALTSEEITKGSPRAFVRYADLVADWRSVLGRLGSTLDLPLEPWTDGVPHPVDDFIDPTLHRVQVDWDEVQIPAVLRDLAERGWDGLNQLADGPEPSQALEDLAVVREDYLELTRDALAMVRSSVRRLEQRAWRKGRRKGERLSAAATTGGDTAGAPAPTLPERLLRRLRGGSST